MSSGNASSNDEAALCYSSQRSFYLFLWHALTIPKEKRPDDPAIRDALNRFPSSVREGAEWILLGDHDDDSVFVKMVCASLAQTQTVDR